MPNLKFSQFETENNTTNVTGIVGYNTTANKNIQITPANLLSSLPGGPFLPLAGGTMTGNILFGNGVRAQFGNGGISEVFHTGSNFVASTFSGDFIISNYADDKDIIFQNDDGSGGVVAYLTLDGSATNIKANKDIRFNDSVQAQFGTGGDLKIYHDGTNNYIETGGTGTGDIVISQSIDDKNIIFKSDNGSGGAVEYFRVDGGITKTVFVRDTKHLDANKALFGDQDDLQIYHDGSNSYIDDAGAGDLRIRSNFLKIEKYTGETMATFNDDNAVSLYFNNSKKFETTNTGISVTGNIDLTDGQNNVLIGTSAGANITTGSSNTLIGDVAGDALTTGNNNVTLGYSSLSAETAGDRSVAIGNFALQVQNNTINTDAYNTAVGYAAGASVSTGVQNTILGGLAGDALTTGMNNVALGYNALGAEVGNSANVAIGTHALEDQTSASGSAYNTAVGHAAGRNITTGTKNTILGGLAGDAMNTAVDNVALGYKALSADQGGARSTAIGSNALASQVVASSGNMYNTALGFGAGQSVTGASQNTFIGALAGGSATSGTNNTVIGALAEKSAITAANEITLGNSSIATLRCQVTSITALSDERDKTSIEDLPYGLDFVNSLQPKKFVWDHRAETRVETDEEGNETQVEFYSSNKGKKDIGFIAQELQSVDNEFTQLVYNSNPEKLQATYGRLVPVLVKAIQDLSAKVTALENA